jgi:hypothetical protein
MVQLVIKFDTKLKCGGSPRQQVPGALAMLGVDGQPSLRRGHGCYNPLPKPARTARRNRSTRTRLGRERGHEAWWNQSSSYAVMSLGEETVLNGGTCLNRGGLSHRHEEGWSRTRNMELARSRRNCEPNEWAWVWVWGFLALRFTSSDVAKIRKGLQMKRFAVSCSNFFPWSRVAVRFQMMLY